MYICILMITYTHMCIYTRINISRQSLLITHIFCRMQVSFVGLFGKRDLYIQIPILKLITHIHPLTESSRSLNTYRSLLQNAGLFCRALLQKRPIFSSHVSIRRLKQADRWMHIDINMCYIYKYEYIYIRMH